MNSSTCNAFNTRTFLFLLLLGAIAAGGCKRQKPDRTTVRGTFALYMGISTQGNYQALFPLLVSRLRDKIAMAHGNIRQCVGLIQDHFPPALKAQALESLGPPGVRVAKTPDQHLAVLMDAAGRPALDIRERLTSKIKRIRQVMAGTYEVTTVSGARLRFVRKGDGRFYLVPTDRDVRLIHQQYLLSMERLDATKKTVKTLGFNK
ncbi:MAG: hypothetical protein ISR64_11015 [Deltaproteobacteria bacterium]|nr:hypothetical protein [Deltaproteobacteria bacterium]